MHKKEVRTSGANLHVAKKALILLHGRGAPAEANTAVMGCLSTAAPCSITAENAELE